MIRVLVVEDSPVARELLTHILHSDDAIQVIGSAENGRKAVEFMSRNKPDLITMDIHMPEMDGFEATRIIMETNPVPIVIVTGSCDAGELETSFRAIEAGALTVLQKPLGMGDPDHEKNARNLIATVKLMSEIKVVRRWTQTPQRRPPLHREPLVHLGPEDRPRRVELVAMGASAGGPSVIERILAGLPREFPSPILIVQHMAEGFIQGFAEWLGKTSPLPVQVPFHGSRAQPGHVYIAPDGHQMRMEAAGRISCTADCPENGIRPSVSYLFRWAAEVFGRNSVGVLLTGMGRDGALELRMMREKGAVTIAQDEESSAVFGMPGEAVRLEAATYVLPPDKISMLLTKIAIPNQDRFGSKAG